MNLKKLKKLLELQVKLPLKMEKPKLDFHDGRSVISDTKVNVGDSCLIQIPDQKILDVLKLEKECTVLVTRGVNAGKVGKIENIEEGTFILPKRILLALEERKIEIPSDVVMVIGKEEPVIQIK